MRAVIAEKHGGPDVLRLAERDTPTPGPGQLLVEVTAAGVNFADIYRRQGLPPYGGNVPYVSQAPKGRGRLRPPARPRGRHQGRLDRRARQLCGAGARSGGSRRSGARRGGPGGGRGRHAAGHHRPLPVDRHLPRRQRRRVVVHAAAGGVGLLLTQMVKMRGGVVIATTSTKEKAELAQERRGRPPHRLRKFGTVIRKSPRDGAAVGLRRGRRGPPSTTAWRVRAARYMVLYGGASGPVPPWNSSASPSAGRCSSPAPRWSSYIATRDELVRRADDLFTWIRRARWLRYRSAARTRSTRPPAPTRTSPPGAHRQAAAAAGLADSIS